MKAEVKQLWLDALRSGEYKQVDGALRKDDQFCCLGVLCDVALKNGVDLPVEKREIGWGPHDVIYSYGDEKNTDALPDEVREWAGLEDRDPEVKFTDTWTSYDGEEMVDDIDSTLSAANDDYSKTFPEIAALIEEQL